MIDVYVYLLRILKPVCYIVFCACFKDLGKPGNKRRFGSPAVVGCTVCFILRGTFYKAPFTCMSKPKKSVHVYTHAFIMHVFWVRLQNVVWPILGKPSATRGRSLCNLTEGWVQHCMRLRLPGPSFWGCQRVRVQDVFDVSYKYR